MMTSSRLLMRFLGPLALALAAGCAPAYHAYPGCYVDCKYCPPPPLPYAHYQGCACHSCAAASYLSAQPRPVEEGAETDADE